MITINGIIKRIAKDCSLEQKQINRTGFVLSSGKGEVCKLEFSDKDRTRLLLRAENEVKGLNKKNPLFFPGKKRIKVKENKVIWEKEIELNYPYDLETYHKMRAEIDYFLLLNSMNYIPSENLHIELRNTN